MTDITIGTFLKELRLKKGFSLERLAAETKISLSILKKLESDDLKSLPNITYVKGYLQNCLKSLHTPIDQTTFDIINHTYTKLGLMNEVSAVKNVTAEQVTTNQSNVTQGTVYNIESLLSKKVIVSTILVILTILTFQFITKINKQDSARFSSIPKPSAINTLSSPTLTIMGEKEKIKSEMPIIANAENQKTVDVPSPVVTASTAVTPMTPSTTTIDAKVQLPYVEFKKINNIALTVDANASENKDSDLYSDDDKEKMVDNKENVYITSIDGESWISYKKDNETPRSILLKKGQKLLISGDKLFINIGNTKSIRIFHNGKFVRFVDYKGVKSFIFPLADAPNHYLPLFARDDKGKIYFYADYIPLMSPKPTDISSSNSEQLKPTPQN